MKPRLEKLLLDVAGHFDRACQPMHHEWLVENNVSSDELGAVSDQLAMIVRGYVQSSDDVQLAIMAASVMPDKASAQHVAGVVQSRRVMQNLRRASR